jgi:hypothetical protein
MNVKVHYACDSKGDHKALTQHLIDTDVKNFENIQKAIAFATECTEVLNIKELLKEAGVTEELLSVDFQEEDLLLLDLPEFSRYREQVFY